MNVPTARRLLGSLTCGVALTIVLGGEALAAERPPNVGTTLRGIEQRRPQVPEDRAPSLRLEQPVRPAMQAEAGVTFRVAAVRISGATVYSDLELLPLVAGLAGAELTLADLDAAAARITDHYRSNGYPVARAYVPAQTIEGGAVEIAVLEGRYGELDVRNSSRLSDALVRDALRAPTADAVIEAKPLDRDLRRLKRFAGVDVAATLTPGERVGTADLVVDVTPTRTWSGTFESDNYGNRYTGEWRYGGSVAAANLAGRGDLLSVRGLTSQDSGLWYGRAAYQIPVFTSGLTVGGALSHTYYSLGEEFSSLDADGEADVYSMFAEQPLIRGARGNLDLHAAFDAFDLRDRIDAADTENPRRLNVFTIGVSGNVHDDLLGGGLSAASLAFGTGEVDIRDDTALAIDRITAQADGDFDVAHYSALRVQRLGKATQLYVAVQGQIAGNNLDSSQKFVLGGPNAVRAYAQGDGVGDEGVLATAEIRFQLPSRGTFRQPQISLFFDSGDVNVNAEPFLPTKNGIDLQGAGIGFSVDVFNGFTLRGSFAWRVGSDSLIEEENSNSQSWLQVVKTF